MNKSVREICTLKCTMVSLEKNPKEVDFCKPDYQNTALTIDNRNFHLFRE